MKLRLWYILGILALVSCHPRTVLYTFHSLENETWQRSDTLTYPVDSLEAGDYDLEVYLRLSNKYAYNVLWTVVEQDWKDGKTRHRDTLQIIVADEDGRLKGGGINGKQITQTVPPLHINRAKHGCLRIYHIMRPNEVEGVRDVGIRAIRQ